MISYLINKKQFPIYYKNCSQNEKIYEINSFLKIYQILSLFKPIK